MSLKSENEAKVFQKLYELEEMGLLEELAPHPFRCPCRVTCQKLAPFKDYASIVSHLIRQHSFTFIQIEETIERRDRTAGDRRQNSKDRRKGK